MAVRRRELCSPARWIDFCVRGGRDRVGVRGLICALVACAPPPSRRLGALVIVTAGNRKDAVNYMINGVTLNNLACDSISFQPSIDSVDEFTPRSLLNTATTEAPSSTSRRPRRRRRSVGLDDTRQCG